MEKFKAYARLSDFFDLGMGVGEQGKSAGKLIMEIKPEKIVVNA